MSDRQQPFDGGGTPLVARALEHDMALVAQTVTVRRRSSAQQPPAAAAGLNPATGGATGGVWPPASQTKRMRLSPSENVDDLLNWRPGADARAPVDLLPQFAARPPPVETTSELGQRPEGMVNTYEARA